jgi:hypothetical protein
MPRSVRNNYKFVSRKCGFDRTLAASGPRSGYKRYRQAILIRVSGISSKKKKITSRDTTIDCERYQMPMFAESAHEMKRERIVMILRLMMNGRTTWKQ